MKQLIIITILALVSQGIIAQKLPFPRKNKDNGWMETLEKITYEHIEGYYDSIPAVIYSHMTTPPEYPGGIREMEKFIIKNFNYPGVAWQDTLYRGKNISNCQCIIRTDGKAIILLDKRFHPELKKEAARVFSMMPRWRPAVLNGETVNISFNLMASLLDKYFGIPKCALPKIKKARAAAKSIDSHYGYGISKKEAEKVASTILDIHKEGWDELTASLTGARLLATLGQYDDAFSVIENEQRRYHLLGTYKDSIMTLVTDDDYYQPNKDLNATITLAAIYDKAGKTDKARLYFNKAIKLIDLFIFHGIGSLGSSTQHFEHYYDMMKEKVNIVKNSKSPGIGLNPSERRELNHEYLLTDANRVINERIDEGKISNARVAQLDGLMHRMLFDERQNRKTVRHATRLYQLRAMLIGLRDGREAEKRYITQLASGEMTGRKIAKRMAEWSKKTDEPVCDRNQMLEALVLYAPLNVTGEKTEANKTAAEAFYDTRRKLEDIYPLKWLWK